MGYKHRICDYCGCDYYGQGKKYCSIECRGKAVTGKSINFSQEHKDKLSELCRLRFKDIKLSDDHKNKISVIQKKLWLDDKYKNNQSLKRKVRIVSEITKDKISNTQKGVKLPSTSLYNKNRGRVFGWHHSIESKNKIRNGVSGENNGNYGKLPIYSKYQIYTDINGIVYKMRSSWEAKLAKYFDDNYKTWEYESKTFDLSIKSTYTPDFFCDNIYYEVKGYFHEKSRLKFECFKLDYPDIKIILADRAYLTSICIKL